MCRFFIAFQSTEFANFLANENSSSSLNRSPWFHLLRGEKDKCKERGNFYSSYSKLCGNSGTELRDLDGEAYTLHLMKAITAAFYGIRDMTNANSKLADADVSYRYKKLQQVEIPNTLEENYTHDQPFTQPSCDSSTYGNGQVGYTVYHFKKVNSKLSHVELQQTGIKVSNDIGHFSTVPEFYVNSKPSHSMISENTKCPAKSPPLDKYRETIPLVAAVAAMAVFSLSMIILVLVMLCK